jgi:predicted DNA-binding transcriptional regulator AlpA
MELMTKSDVCGVLGISERTLENYVRVGRFPRPVFIGKRALWAQEAVKRWREQVFATQLGFEVRANRAVRTASGVIPRRAG